MSEPQAMSITGALEAFVERLGPMDASHILVLRGADPDLPLQLREALIASARQRGAGGNAADYMPLIVTLADDASLTDLDEADMNAAGWWRAPVSPEAHTRQEDTAAGAR